MRCLIIAIGTLVVLSAPAYAECSMTNEGRTICMGADGTVKIAKTKHAKRIARRSHTREATVDANGNSTVRSSTGIVVRVAPAARASLQCVVDYVERAGVKITSMRGYGRGTVRESVHPIGYALDINQYARNKTRPHVPPGVSNAAGESCGVISGAGWNDKDNGHWNLSRSAIARH